MSESNAAGGGILAKAVRLKFRATSREGATAGFRRIAAAYADLARDLGEAAGARVVPVPLMRGVDEDMRRWSFFMLLEHNAIVNRAISAVTCQLAREEALSGDALVDPKAGVLPAGESGPEQIGLFEESVASHIREVERLPELRGTRQKNHPIFGPFDAHCWHCMLGFHLRVHWKQAQLIADGARAQS